MNHIASARDSAFHARIFRRLGELSTNPFFGRTERKWHVLACIEGLTADPSISPDRFNRYDPALCVEIARACRRGGNVRLRRYWSRLAVAARVVRGSAR